MHFSKVQQLAMNLVADSLAEAKKEYDDDVKLHASSEMYKGCIASGFAEHETVYVLADVAMRVKVTVDTIDVVK